MDNFKYERSPEIETYQEDVTPPKKWCYAERAGKVQQDHVITVTKKRFTHEVSCIDSKSRIYKRTDINLEDIHSDTHLCVPHNML